MKFLVTFIALMSVFTQAYADNIICIGDSQTAIRPPLVATDTYCAKMAYATGRIAVNKGVGGNTSTDVLNRLSADVLSQPGSCVVVMVGANDAFIDPNATYNYSSYWTAPQPSAVSLSQYRSNLTSIVQQIKQAGKSVTLITPWVFFSTPELVQFVFYADMMKQVGATESVPVLDADAIQRNLWWGSAQWLTQNAAPSLWDLEQDYQHPNAAGHTKIQELCNKPQNRSSCACS